MKCRLNASEIQLRIISQEIFVRPSFLKEADEELDREPRPASHRLTPGTNAPPAVASRAA